MATQRVAGILQAFLDAVNNKKWDEVQKHLQPAATVAYNSSQESRDDFVKRLAAIAEKGDRLTADSWTIDEAAQFVSARLVTSGRRGRNARASLGLGPRLLRGRQDFPVLPDCLHAEPGLQRRPWAPEIASKPSKTPLTASEIGARYREYIHSYNDGTTATVIPQRWGKIISLNGKTLSLDEVLEFFRNILLPVIAGLKYHVEEMVVDVERQQVAVRLYLEGVPENEHLQKKVPGKTIKVYEHALYGLEEGKISWVWAAQGFDMTPRQL
ncbi:LOW QUALITY PROTEIN: snoaL-like polyketide cyclase [Colletotrichum tofieldiae]|nr:LOW QUALITY PROTEIN: snoaL-like polyketide cyclase [Colletotrichum tofieldiae]